MLPRRIITVMIMSALLIATVKLVGFQFHFEAEKIQNYSNKTFEAPEIPPECACKSNKTGEIYDFCYRFPENPMRKGKKFSCEWVEKWEEIESPAKSKFISFETDEIPEPVFLAALDSVYFDKGLRLVSALRRLGYRNKFVIYDLGVNPEALEKFQKAACNVEIRKFNFSAYPDYVKKLKEYRWKAIAIAETLRDYGAVWYLDTSLIIKKPGLTELQEFVKCQKTASEQPTPVRFCQKSPYLLHSDSGHGIWAATHPGVFSYLPSNIKKLKKREAWMFEAGFIFTVNSQQAMIDIVKWYFLCSLEKDCMAPPGAQLTCTFGKDWFTRHAGCHRYDQSVINVLLANLYWYDSQYYSSGVNREGFFEVNRSPTMYEEHFECE